MTDDDMLFEPDPNAVPLNDTAQRLATTSRLYRVAVDLDQLSIAHLTELAKLYDSERSTPYALLVYLAQLEHVTPNHALAQIAAASRRGVPKIRAVLRALPPLTPRQRRELGRIEPTPFAPDHLDPVPPLTEVEVAGLAKRGTGRNMLFGLVHYGARARRRLELPPPPRGTKLWI